MPPWTDYVAVMNDSDGAALSGAAKTATFNSETINPAGCDVIGIVVDINTVTGTSPTLNIAAQMSFDGGTTWLATFPAAINSETDWSLTEITAAIETADFFPNWVPSAPSFRSSIVPRMRFTFTIGGTNPSFTMTNIYLIRRSFAGGGGV